MSYGFQLESHWIRRIALRWRPRIRMKNNFLKLTIALSALVTVFLFICPLKYLYIPQHPKDFHRNILKIHFLSGGESVLLKGQGNGTMVPWNYGTSVWNHPRLDILHVEPRDFLPNFKNPCWYEPLKEANVYQNSKYSLFSRHVRLNMLDLIQEWSDRLTKHKEAKRLRCLPYFFIVGQPKCGSTDMFSKITQHPDVVTPSIKETHWWSRNRQGRSLNYTDIIPMSDYIDTFDKAALKIERHTEPSEIDDIKYHKLITGEASVSMLWDNDDWQHFPENLNATHEPLYVIPDYLHHIIPKAKLIILLRNPTERLFSDYLYFSKTNKSAEDFHQRVSLAIDTYNNCSMNHTIRNCVYNRTLTLLATIRLRVGMYVVYLKDWLRVFPRNQILILRLEDYAKNIPAAMGKVYSFLNLRPLTKKESKRIFKSPVVNKRKFKDKKVGKMRNDTKKLLDDFYRPLNERLAEMLEDDRFLWKSKIDTDTLDEDADTYYSS